MAFAGTGGQRASAHPELVYVAFPVISTSAVTSLSRKERQWYVLQARMSERAVTMETGSSLQEVK